MIVKNEEARMNACLASFCDLVDEIIIVGTGSTDSTMDICRTFPKVKLYEHPWQNDFSLHRNQSIEYATGDWIFIVDADEIVKMRSPAPGAPPYNAQGFRKWLSSMDQTTLQKNIHSSGVEFHDMQQGRLMMKLNSARLFRKGHIKYEGIVHNQAMVDGRNDGTGVLCPIFLIEHFGYDLTPEQAEAKEQRTAGLLLKRLEENPADWECWFYLTQVYTTRKKLEKAVEAGEKYLPYVGHPYFNYTIFFTMVYNYLELRNLKKAGEWLTLALKHLPRDIDIAFAQVDYGLAAGIHDHVFNGGRRYINLFREYETNPGAKGNNFTFTHNQPSLAAVLYHIGTQQVRDGMEAIFALQDILPKCDKNFMEKIVTDTKEFLSKYGIQLEADIQYESGTKFTTQKAAAQG